MCLCVCVLAIRSVRTILTSPIPADGTRRCSVLASRMKVRDVRYSRSVGCMHSAVPEDQLKKVRSTKTRPQYQDQLETAVLMPKKRGVLRGARACEDTVEDGTAALLPLLPPYRPSVPAIQKVSTTRTARQYHAFKTSAPRRRYGQYGAYRASVPRIAQHHRLR